MSSSDSAPEVVVVGSMNRDYVCRVGRLPRPGETVLGGEVLVAVGGKGGNQAAAAALMGVTTVMIGAVGDDDDGQALIDGLHAAGADVSHVSIRPAVRSGAAFVFVADDGENSIVVAPGANQDVTPELLDRELADLLSPANVVVVQGEVPLASVRATVAAAGRFGARVVVNLAPYVPLEPDSLSGADPLVVNETEAAQVLARAVEGPADAQRAAADLLEMARSAVITVGSAGAVYAERASDGKPSVHLLPAARVAVVDTTGAGDAFTGVLAAALSRGTDLRTAVELGILAGTHAVTGLGAQSSYPSAADLDPVSTSRVFAGPHARDARNDPSH